MHIEIKMTGNGTLEEIRRDMKLFAQALDSDLTLFSAIHNRGEVEWEWPSIVVTFTKDEQHEELVKQVEALMRSRKDPRFDLVNHPEAIDIQLSEGVYPLSLDVIYMEREVVMNITDDPDSTEPIGHWHISQLDTETLGVIKDLLEDSE